MIQSTRTIEDLKPYNNISITTALDMNIVKKLNKSWTDGESFLMILFATLFILFLDFSFSLHLTHISLPFKISSAIADTCVIIIPCMFLRGKWRVIGVLATWTVGIILYANILYHRYFEDLLQASSYLNADIGDPAITSGVISSFHIYDMLFLILPICPLAYLLWKRREVLRSPIRKNLKICIAAICLMSWSFSYAGVFRRMILWHPDESYKKVAELIFSKDSLTWRDTYEMHNFSGYVVKCIVSCFNIGMDLTPKDISVIKRHLSNNDGKRAHFTDDSLSTLEGRNLIMIIVESLPFKVIEKPEVAKLIPTIMKITADSSSIVSKCRILADYGRSSDAQFIYNTGLLPLRNEALVDNYAFNDYPSIAKALNRQSMEIIGENKGLWMHSLTTKSYGFDTLIDNIASKGMDQDSVIFKRAEIEVSKLITPFYLFVTTISMHDPFDDQKVTDESAFPHFKVEDERDREYYARLRHFDRSLERFLAILKSKGLYDDSVIVILGDHEIQASKISTNLHDEYVPFIIINSPLKSKEGLLTTQLDVFPSLLDMMGKRYSYLDVEYSGLGQSIFSDKAQAGEPYLPTDSDYNVSEMIIKGRPSM